MYDNEEEIKRKRRNLIIIIAVIVIFIILLLLFLLTYGKGNKKPTENKKPTCELKVVSGTIGADGIYNSEVVVGIEATPISENIQIVEKKVGTSENPRNKETYTITKKGKIKVYGYIKDANGNTGICEKEIEVNPSKPTCELEVISGTLGNNEWYTSDIVVGFKSKETNSETATISKFYIEKKTSEIDTDKVVRGEVPATNIEKYTITDNLTTQLFGYVIDSNGNEGTCSITVKKDTDLPTCELKVEKGTLNSSGLYTSEVIVGFNTASDPTSDIAEKGIGTSKNYKEEIAVVSAPGNTVMYGYVKDNAGNEGTCNLTIKRPTSSGGGEKPPVKTSNPTCSLRVVGKLSGSTYIGETTVTFNTKATTNNAYITSVGMGTTPQINGKESIVLTTEGTHTIHGMVKDSYGNTSTCSITVAVKKEKVEDKTLANKVAVGDFVNYNAGTWPTNEDKSTINKTDGQFSGYKAGTNRKTGVTCASGDVAQSGWKVLSVSNGKVTLIHAGIPECYYYGLDSDASSAIKKITERAAVYKDKNFAESASMLTYAQANSMTKEQRNIGAYYYLAGEKKDNKTLWAVGNNNGNRGGELMGRSGWAQGIRPTVTLKTGVKTTGKGANGWELSW